MDVDFQFCIVIIVFSFYLSHLFINLYSGIETQVTLLYRLIK